MTHSTHSSSLLYPTRCQLLWPERWCPASWRLSADLSPGWQNAPVGEDKQVRVRCKHTEIKGEMTWGIFFFFYSLWTPCQHSWSPFSPALTQSRRTGSWSHAWSVWWFLSAKLGRLGGNRPYWSAGPGTPSPRTADTQEDVFEKIIQI